MVENLVDFLQKFFTPEIITIIISALPISELRGAIPIAILGYGFSPLKAFLLCVFGNFLPVIPVLFFLNYLIEILKKVKIFDKFFNWWFALTKKRTKIVEKYESAGLALFVAIPLPITGAWSGCVAAFLFRIRFLYSFVSILIGIIIAGIIVTLATTGIKNIF